MSRELRGWHAERKSDHEYNKRDFRPRGERKGNSRRVTRHYAPIGAGLVSNGQEKRSRERSEVYKTRQSRKRVWSHKEKKGLALERPHSWKTYWSLRLLDVLSWPVPVAWKNNKEAEIVKYSEPAHYQYSYLPTPPIGQDMTQGQFLSGI